MTKTLLIGKLLIDGTGREPIWNPAICIQEGRITAILTKEEADGFDQEEIQVLDYSDKAILPGLIDAHVHLCFSAGPDNDSVRRTLKTEDGNGLLPFRVLRNAQEALKGGITTLRDSGDKGLVTLSVRDAVQSGMVVGPRIVASGMPITTRGGHLHYCGLTADTDDEILEAVKMLCDKGVDWIKVMATGGQMTAESNPLASQYSKEQLKDIVHEAHGRGRKVEAHVLNTGAIEDCVLAGVDHIAHCLWQDEKGGVNYLDDLAAQIIQKEIFVEMTVAGNVRRLLPIPDESSTQHQAKLEELKDYFGPMRKMRQAGVKILVKSDAGVRLTDFDTFSQGLRLMSLALDAPPMDVILAATKLPAEALGMADEIGTVEVNKQADLMAVDMNPLEDITRIGEVAMVMKEGEIVVKNGKLVS